MRGLGPAGGRGAAGRVAGAAAWRLAASSSWPGHAGGRGDGLLAGSRDGRGVVAVQDAVGVPDDAGGGCGDAVPGGEDGRRGLGARVAAGPACRVGKLAAGGDAVPGAGDVGDGVGFGLAQSRAAGGGRPGRVSAGRAVQQDVAELVRQRPDGLFAGQAGQEPDAAGGPEGGAVGWRAVFALDGESFAAGQPAQRIPQARRGLAGRGQAGRDGERLSRWSATGPRRRPPGRHPARSAAARRRHVRHGLAVVWGRAGAGCGRSRCRSRGGGPAARSRSIAGSPGPWWRRAAGRR